MVSSYFQATKPIPEFTHYTGTISGFVRSRGYGIKKLVTFYNLWHENQKVTEDFILIKYEDMHADTQNTLRLVLEFIGVNDIKAEAIESAVNYASFSNMKKMEQGKEFSSKIMQAGNQSE
ncbi:MAG: sulfotransferase domain-containing protein [Hormoscilla sp. GUM202]|nr:sulfotransferase domain-containing protein [Hormoscilla sp. GUM202]